jgi:HK97 family phage major capsid protein
MTSPNTVTTANVGPNLTLTPDQVQRILVQPLQAASVFLSQGCRMFESNGNQIRIPKQALPDDASLTFTGESEVIPEQQYNFGEVVLLPSTMKSVKVIVRFSSELARQFVVSLDQALQSRVTTDVAAKIDAVLIASSITDGTEPTGLLHYAGVQVMPTIGDISVDDLYDAESLALTANVDANNLRWMIRPETWTKVRKLKASGSGEYMVEPDPTKQAPKSLLGYPVTITPRIPIGGGGTTTQAVLWDPSQVAVARDMAPSVVVLRELFAGTDEIGLRVITRYDAGPLNAQAVVRMDGINL